MKVKRDVIFFIEKNIHGAWVIYGELGVRQYYGYTKAQARKMYIESSNIIINERG